jgi:hypothetical protein
MIRSLSDAAYPSERGDQTNGTYNTSWFYLDCVINVQFFLPESLQDCWLQHRRDAIATPYCRVNCAARGSGGDRSI